MYSEDFEEGSVEFEEEAVDASSPHAAAQQPEPVPLDDAELDAYLQADEQAAQACVLEPAGQAEETVTEGFSTDADAAAALELHAEPSADQQVQASSSAGGNPAVAMPTAEDPPDPGTDVLEASASEEELVQSVLDAIPSPDPAQDMPCESPAQPAATTPYSPAVPYSSSMSGSELVAISSARSSMRSSRTASVAGAQTLEHSSHVPATQQATPAVTVAAFSAETPVHANSPLFSTQRDSQDDGWISSVLQPKARPASASPVIRRSSSTRDRAQEQQPYSPQRSSQAGSQQQQALEVMPVASWTVNDVCDWVDGLGLSQYRKKFMHHVVNGRLLLRLNDALLKTELAIGPLGHRVLILDGVQAVAAADLQAAAAAALSGTSPEDYQAETACSSPSSAAAVLVAGLIALKACQQQGCSSGRNSPGRLMRGGSSALGGSPVNTFEAALQGSPDRASPVPRRGRPCSAPCKGKGRERSASPSGGRGVSMSPGALGPAAGRISVYEQRAKILFELSRAQARAAATAGTATEVSGIAQLAQKEVAMLQGQLADLDKKNKLAVQHASGSVDSRGIIPWQHVGNGTKAADPHPERIARPWDSPDVELTFKPKISAKSQQLMAETRGSEGTGGFLDRLDNDMRRREAKQKELEKRYYCYNSIGLSDAAKAGRAAVADVSTLAAFFSQRGWASLTLPSSSDGSSAKQVTESDYRELDSQLDEVLESYSEELGLGKSDSKHCHAALVARGPKKVAAVLAAVRTVQFMDRYHSDLNTRGSRLQQLQDNYFKPQPVSTGGRPAAVPLTQEQKDLAQAVRWFKGMGWQDAADSDDCDDMLSSLIKRARHYKAEAEKLHDKERAAATAAGSPVVAAHATALPHPTINWAAAPWSVDGLGAPMQAVLDERKAAAEAAAGQQAADPKQASKAAPAEAGGASSSAVSAATLEAAAANGAHTLDLSVRLLAGMRWAGLDQLDAARGKAKKLAVYRALRTQQFLAFTAADLANRDAKQKALLQEFEASRKGKLVSKAELDDFYQRLQADGDRRRAELERARAAQAEREAKALALVSVGPGFSRRPRSAKT